MTQQKFRCYQCDEDDCSLLTEKLSICENAIYCLKSTLQEEDGRTKNSRGCITKVEHGRLVCNSRVQMSSSRYRSTCCTEDFCNNGTFPILEAPEKIVDTGQGTDTTQLTLTILVPFLTVGIIIIIALYYRYYRKNRLSIKKYEGQQRGQQQSMLGPDSTVIPRSDMHNVPIGSECSLPDLKIIAVCNNTAKEHLDDQSSTNDSGSGKTLLVQSNLSKKISLAECFEEGSFGEQAKLWRGILQGENVMVKVYSSRSEAMWINETEVYTKLAFAKPENILRYVGSDRIDMTSCTQLWLVTHYYPNGSLKNYLKETTLSQNKMFKACLSLTCGLLYLHTEINSTKRKLSMAHRNLSSSNVFVKSDGVCAIGGFEHTVTQENLDEINFLEHASKRYMSPELLQPTFEHEIWSLEGFQQADIYSLSLIFWEISRRCVSNKDIVLDYEAPFADLLDNNDREPTVEEMRKFIVADGQRPGIPDHWHLNPVMAEIANIIQMCWQTKAAARLPITHIKKTLLKLINS